MPNRRHDDARHSRPRRVVIDASALRSPSGVRGIGRYLFELLAGLSETRAEWKDELTLFAVGALVPPHDQPSADLLGVAEAGLAARRTADIGELRWQRRYRFPRTLRRVGAELLHLTEPGGTPLPLPRPVPYLATLYDLIPLVYPDRYDVGPLGRHGYRFAAKRRYGNAKRVVAISRRSRMDALRFLDLDPERIEVVPTGVDLARWSRKASVQDDRAQLARLGVGQRPYVVYVGHADYRKNTPALLRTVARARELGLGDLELAWAGTPPD